MEAKTFGIPLMHQGVCGRNGKLWNRLSLGSYFPPPVKKAEIRKKAGGTRVLGIPTVVARVS